MDASVAEPATKKPPQDNWLRPLRGERVEISLRHGGFKMRASGEAAQVWQMVEHFEAMTGIEVLFENRPARKGPPPIAGQLAMDELQSDGDGED